METINAVIQLAKDGSGIIFLFSSVSVSVLTVWYSKSKAVIIAQEEVSKILEKKDEQIEKLIDAYEKNIALIEREKGIKECQVIELEKLVQDMRTKITKFERQVGNQTREIKKLKDDLSMYSCANAINCDTNKKLNIAEGIE